MTTLTHITTPYPIYAVFGGTFDPIHNGHLQPVSALAQEANLPHIYLLPNNVPPHRPQPEANVTQRLDMLSLAIKDHPIFSIDQRELERESPSYTLETLKQIRDEIGPKTPIAFIIGQDSLLTLPTWNHWQSLLKFCHLLVCARPGYAKEIQDHVLKKWVKQHQVLSPETIFNAAHGYIYIAHTPLIDISATDIRRRLNSGESCTDLLPESVIRYIHQNNLYQ